MKLGTEWKTTFKSTIKPTIRDLEWAAGFIEGEGSFLKIPRLERVEVWQVNVEPIIKLALLFGGNVRFDQNKKQRDDKYKRQNMNVWTVSGARARGVMMTLYSLLSQKRKNEIRKALLKEAII